MTTHRDDEDNASGAIPFAPTARQWVHRLRPADSAPPPATTVATVADAVDRLGALPVEWAYEVGYTMAARVVEEIPELGGGSEPFDTVRMGTESSVIRAMLWLSGLAAGAPAITEEALAGVPDFVHRGITLDRLLRGIRLGHAEMSKAFMTACSQLVPAEQRPEQMQRISDVLFDYIDEFSGPMVTHYINERDRWMASAAAARDEAVRRVLAGELTDPTHAQHSLGYDLSRQHVAATLWFEPARSRAKNADLQTVAHDTLTRLGATKLLIMPIGAGRLWAWGSRGTFTPFPSVDDLPPTHPDVRIALGTPAPGLEGFRRSHEEASTAERAARVSSAPGRWATFYADVAIPALLTTDMSAARHLVQRELGPLAANTAHASDLRSTLLIYFEEESSPFAAARRLHVSRNTVAYRVKRASELLGYDIATRRYELHTALRLIARFGPQHLLTRTDQPPGDR
ncbi:PucR family transcriptional regulator [Rhodococcus sp. 2H158]